MQQQFEVMGIIGSLVSDMMKAIADLSLLTGNTHRPNDSVGASHAPDHSISETAINQIPFSPGSGNAIMSESREVYERDKR